MKLSQSLDRTELSSDVLAAFSGITETLVDELVEKFDKQLQKNGKFIAEYDLEYLRKLLKQEISIKTSITASITPKKLETWNISVLLNTQTTFEDPEVVKV